MFHKQEMTEHDTISTDGYADPFDRPLNTAPSEKLILKDTYFAAARESITVDDMEFAFLKPPYMNFFDQIKTKERLREAYGQREFLLLYGYSGCGKTTLLSQFEEKYPTYARYFEDFDSMSPAQLLVSIGESINIPIKQRTGQLEVLKKYISSIPRLILLFDEVTASTQKSIEKLENLRKLHDATRIPIILCGTPYLHKCIYANNKFDLFSSLISRLDEHKMNGMRQRDAGEYIDMIAQKENVRFTYPAEQALIDTALNTGIGGINAFMTILGRCITLARVNYFTAPGRTIPAQAKCIRSEVPETENFPGAKLTLTLPATPEPILIDEKMVCDMQSAYKSHFPMLIGRKIIQPDDQSTI